MNKIEFGDCREIMRQWKVQGIKAQMCVTSPPYYGLRDYKTGTWIGGAIREDLQIGLEETPEEYIKAMVEVFRCVWDCLADDGVIWVNIGDSYVMADGDSRKSGSTIPSKGLKEKDLIGIPWMLAFALRADGWYLRQDIIWHKPNPMPESVRDRCGKAHEYIFLLSKSKQYFFDHEAIKEPLANPGRTNFQAGSRSNGVNDDRNDNDLGERSKSTTYINRNKRSVWTANTKPYKGAHFAVFPSELIVSCILAGSKKGDVVLDPFMGSGTTAMVAIKHGRQYLGCELNPDYAELQQERIDSMAGIASFHSVFSE